MDFDNNKDRIVKAFDFSPKATEEDFRKFFERCVQVEAVKRYLTFQFYLRISSTVAYVIL
jgi:hypothetical protein